MKIPFFIYAHLIVYTLVITTTTFRKKLNYSLRALTVICLLFFLAAIDFLKTGFLSEGYLWLTSAIIFTTLFFDYRKSIYSLLVSLSLISVIFILYKLGIITFNLDYNTFAYMPITMLIRISNIILLGLTISFSIRYIHDKMNKSIVELKKEKENLESMKTILEKEVDMRRKSEQQVMNSELNFRNIFEKSSEAILIIGDDLTILDFNESYFQMSGFKENEIFLMQYDQLLPEDDHQKYVHYFDNLDTFPGRLEFSTDTPLGQKFFECSSSIINYFGQKAVLFMIRDSTERMDQEKKNYLTAIEAEEKERLRFSKELHDGLGPLLSTLKIYLEVFFSNPNDSEVRERIESTLTESIRSVKEISNNISPYILENMGLVKAVGSFIEKIKYGKILEIDFQSNLNFRLKPEIEISIYRFTTELITNTIKHALASKINIAIEENDNKLEIHYSDNGIGFSIEDVLLNSKGIGLYNLRSRIEKLGGKVEIKTAPDEGFSMFATLKIEHKQE